MPYRSPPLTSAPSFQTTLAGSFLRADPASQVRSLTSTIEIQPRCKSRAPAAAIGGNIRRSMPTPSVKGQAAPESALAGSSSADKRRNKLGYHRTSVACGHCRRRKIRCILAPADAQGRCSNCIRLKKECTFHHVDQQPQGESKNLPDQPGRYEVDTTSEASSPSTQTEAQRGRQDGLHCSPLTMPPIQDVQMGGHRTGSYSPNDQAASNYNSPLPYEYARSSSTWEQSSVPKSGTSEAFNSGWRVPGESPITPASAYSPYTPDLQNHPAHTIWPSIVSEPAPREESWPVPNRSMSYGRVEGPALQGSYPYQHGPLAPRVSQPYPPILSSSASSPATRVGTNVMPLERIGQPAFSMPAWQPYGYGKPPVSNAEVYAGWYSPGLAEHAQASVGEEHQAGNFAAVYYPNASQAGR